MKVGSCLIFIMFMFTTVGCGKMNTKTVLQNVNNGVIDQKVRPACEVKSAEYALDTKVIALEMTSDTGLSMGFDLINRFLKLFKMSFRTKTGRLALAMTLYDPLKPEYELMSVLGQSKLKENEFRFDISYQQIGVGFDSYYKTPLSLLAEKGIEDTLKNMTSMISGLEDEWTTSVVAIPTKDEVVVPVGSFAGLKVGDRFKIFNVEHVWEGQPCASEHLIARKTTAAPLYTARVSQVDKNAAVLKLEIEPNSNPEELLIVGAQVEVLSLTGTAGRKLARSLEIKTVDGATLDFENGSKSVLTPYIQDQIRAVARKFGYSIYHRTQNP